MRNVMRWSLALAAMLVIGAGTVAAQERERVRPDRACTLDCRHEYRLCIEGVREDLGLCREPCAELVEAAREACADDRRSAECTEARTAAAECQRPCREGVSEAVQECRSGLRECVGLCPDAEPIPPSDPECVTGCRERNRACQNEVDVALRECAATCDDLAGAAREICAAEPRSRECQRARRAAVDCLNPCRREALAGRSECLRAGKACVASCGDDGEPSTNARQR